jgi:beta-lactamase regulating signal transducer with metallopeptidase domain
MMASVLDHLWQSTFVALAAALLTIPLRRASAAVRYGLWLTASVKFLVPFAALAALGRLLAPALRSPSSAAPEAVFIQLAVQPLARFPFTPASPPPVPLAQVHAVAAHAPPAAAPHLDPALILLIVWALGSAATLIVWLARWARVRAIARSATPLDWAAPMPVLASSSLMEPGLIGLWRPVLIVPKTLPEHLGRAEIDAVLAHETSHLRRRDNLTAAMHMVVEALFWFHPLVWWIGARLIAEREQACDEAVVRAGHDRAAYARSLVESCRLYLQSPLSCVAGASGSNLKTRVRAIMTAPPALPLSGPAKALLLAAGVCTLATPVAAGLLTSPEGQTAVAQATALVSRLAPVRGDDAPAAPEDHAAAERTTLARNNAVLAADPSVAAIDAAPLPLAQDIPIRLATLEPLPATAQTSPPAPVQAAPPAVEMTDPGDVFHQASSFVRSYATFTPQWMIARWPNGICVRVVGLAPDQAAAVKARVEAVAKAAGVDTWRHGLVPAGCRNSNVEIAFTTDPQRTLDGVMARKAGFLGHLSGVTKTVDTVTRPIQAWYWTYSGRDLGPCSSCSSPDPKGRAFSTVVVIVDLRRTGSAIPGPITDDAAMLALSQPQSLEHCNVLPSVTDLFAGACPGRGAPSGLTAADTAFLKGLYGRNTDRETDGNGLPSAVGERMAHALAMTRTAATVAPAQSAAVAAEPADVKTQTLSFVKAYAATGSGSVIARWRNPICVRVVGLARDQTAAVRARVEQVARAVGIPAQAAGCQRADIEIGFSADPQRMLDGVFERKGVLLGDRTSDTRDARTVTRPIQAWYQTNGANVAANDTGGLKALVSLQYNPQNEAGYREWAAGQGQPTTQAPAYNNPGSIPSAPRASARQFLNVMVIVDVRQAGDKGLVPITDYVAMLALAQPRSTDRCNVLPSVTDLFAGDCPGRAAPGELTPADAAYLTALYTDSNSPQDPIDGARQQRAIAGRMAQILSTAKMAAN